MLKQCDKMKSHKFFRIFGWFLLVSFPLLCQFVLEWFNYNNKLFLYGFITDFFFSALFGTLVISILYLLLLLVFRRGWLAALILGTVSVVFSLINYIKYALNGNHFFPWDFSMTGDLRELLSFTDISIPWQDMALIIFVFFIIFLLWFTGVSLPRSPWYRIIGSVLILIALICPFTNSNIASQSLALFHMKFFDSALQNSNYSANGFIGAFTINLLSLRIEEPDDYSEATIDDILANYSDTEGTEAPDIIVILAESLWDVRELTGTTFSQDPMAIFDELAAADNTVSGKMITSVLGGGTVTSEFNVLTGYTTEAFHAGMSPYTYVNADLTSPISLLKDQGYHTVAIHPYDKTFYARESAYAYLGFDDFYGQDDISSMTDVTYKHGYISDDTFANVIIDQLESGDEDTPKFVFGISMENHQPYNYLDPSEINITVENNQLSEDNLNLVTNYTQGIYDMNLALEKLVDYINSRDKDTILLIFGDHLPTLGTSPSSYQQVGLWEDSGDYTTEQELLRYSTPFLMTANYDIDTSDWNDDGDGDLTISSYYLMSLLAETAKTDRSAYMNLLLDYYQQLPYYDTYTEPETGVDLTSFSNIRRLISYDMALGEKYADEID